MNPAPPRRSWLVQLIQLPFGCLFRLSPFVLLAILAMGAIGGFVV